MYYAQNIEDVLSALKSSENGLSEEEAGKRLKQYGLNSLPRSTEKMTRLKIFASQFTSPLIFILVIAGVVSGALGELIDMTVIFITVAINSMVGFVQEDKANQALKKLRSMVQYRAVVIRGGQIKQIKSEEIAPGDILSVETGDKIQADGRIIKAIGFKANEAALTGESEPNKKSTETLKDKTGVADRTNMLFKGTVAMEGRAVIVVTGTGANTEIGKIASLVKETSEDKTPLQIQLHQMSKYLAVIILAISAGLFFLGVSVKTNEETVLEMFQVAVAVAVAAIPEGLAITLTVILAVGMRHILKRKALVRKLVAAETLGSVSVICTDKTGTITEGKMRITRLITSRDDLDFEEIKILNISKPERHRDALFALRVGILCNDGFIDDTEPDEAKWTSAGDTTDLAFLQAGIKAGLKKKYLESAIVRVDEIAFSSEIKYMATLHHFDGSYAIYAKGAPEIMLDKCGFFEEDGRIEPMTADKKAWIQKQIDNLTDDGLRVLALAYKNTKGEKNKLSANDINDLVFVSLAGLSDPIRSEVKETVELSLKAGIKTVMITGDHVKTARSIAAKIGLPSGLDRVCDGQKLEQMTDDELRAVIEKITIFARVDPVHKIRIVRAFQANGEVVAMTGDGVNDAPAIKAADIGVALGSGSDVTKEISDMILLDDAYSTIVAAVERGRDIYQNIKKVVLYSLSGSFAELILIGGGLIAGLPLAVLPAQILWVNIIEDAFPNMALAFDKGDKENMNDGPRRKGEPLIDGEMKIMIAIISIVSNLVLFGLFLWFLKASVDLAKVRTLMFVGLGIDSLIYIYSVRSLRHMIWRINLFSNRHLNLALLFGWVMLIGSVYFAPLQKLLSTVPLSPREWGIMILFGFFNVALIEIIKYIFLVKKSKKLLLNN